MRWGVKEIFFKDPEDWATKLRPKMHHNPQIDPIFLKGTNGAGVLLVHGFTGTPDCMRPVANELHAQGYTVSAPLLAGHGTTPQQCSKTGWKEWFNSVTQAALVLHEQCSKIFVGGLSLGSLLSLRLAAEYPQIAAIACFATPLYLQPWVRSLLPLVWNSPLKTVWKYQKKISVDIKDPDAKANFWNYDRMPLSCIVSLMELQTQVTELLPKIQMPILLMHSRHDSTAPYHSMNAVAMRVSSTVTETVTLENSYHVITIDYEKELVARKTADFFNRFL